MRCARSGLLAGREEDGPGLQHHPHPAALPGRVQRHQRGLVPHPRAPLGDHQLPGVQVRHPGRAEVRGGAPLQSLPGPGCRRVLRDVPQLCERHHGPRQPRLEAHHAPFPGGGLGGFPEAGGRHVADDLRGGHLQRDHPPHPCGAAGLQHPRRLREVQDSDRPLRRDCSRADPVSGHKGPSQTAWSCEEKAGISLRGAAAPAVQLKMKQTKKSTPCVIVITIVTCTDEGICQDSLMSAFQAYGYVFFLNVFLPHSTHTHTHTHTPSLNTGSGCTDRNANWCRGVAVTWGGEGDTPLAPSIAWGTPSWQGHVYS